MIPRRHHAIRILTLVLLGSWITGLDAHQDPCHRLHTCPSDHGTYVCGDLGHCEQCPDTPYCQGGTPRVSAQEKPLPAQFPSPKVEEASCPAVEVCFTPGEDCTERIVKTLGEAKTSILLQAYSFTSAPIAKALVDAKKCGVRVEAILDKRKHSQTL
jgi:phosphatidylserine/phosphatidylglycerophosphate/cardiolipin synthase-like enzyme